MEHSKMEIKIGEISFHGEGEEKWLTEQLDKILQKADELIALGRKAVPQPIGPAIVETDSAINTAMPLPKALTGVSKDVDRFLAAALWLQKNGKAELVTQDVTKALSEAKQSPIGNSSQALSYNIRKGHCAKKGKKFYVIEEDAKKCLDKIVSKK